MQKHIRNILLGDDADAVDESWASSEDGMVSFVAMVAVLFFVILIGLVGNVGVTVNQKIEVQNAADSTAYSSGVLVARSMNAVTATNHIIGELLALTVLHHAILGPEIDGGAVFQSTRVSASQRPEWRQEYQRVPGYKAKLTEAYLQAKKEANGGGPGSSPYNQMRQWQYNTEGATVFRSKVRLMKVLTSTFWVEAAGYYLQSVKAKIAIAAFYNIWAPQLIVPTQRAADIAGKALVVEAKIFEAKVAQEWYTLEGIAAFARSTSSVRWIMLNMIKGLDFIVDTVYTSPVALHNGFHRPMLNRLEQIGQGNAVKCDTWFGRGSVFTHLTPTLPIREEPSWSALGPQNQWKSQLIRATYPWVNHWRKRPMKIMRELLRLSRAAHHYKDFTNEFTRDLAKELKNKHGINLYILEELNLQNSDKGHEPWTQASGSQDSLRDRLFTHVGFARRDPPALFSTGFYKPENEDGFVCYAQGIVYNANEQYGARLQANCQPRVGWDTLNWVSNVLEYIPRDGDGTEGTSGSYTDNPSDEPRIFINWRTKLVPVSRLSPAMMLSLPSRHRKAVQTLSAPMDQFRTH